MSSQTAASVSEKSIVVLGSCIVDNITYTSKFPSPGETIKGKSVAVGRGGKGANQAVAASKLGGRVKLIARVGDDAMGSFYLDGLAKTGIDCDDVTVTKGSNTGIATITVDDKGENTIIIVTGANEDLSLQDLDAAEPSIAEAGVLVCQCEVNMTTTAAAMRLARKHGVLTLMNAAPLTPDLDPSIVSNSDIFCVNETEAESLLGKPIKDTADALESCKKLVQEKGCGSAVITLGRQGAVYYNKDGEQGHLPTPVVTAVDTTGAGDAFVGALAMFLVCFPDLEFPEMIRRSCVVASVAVQKKGTQSSFPSRSDLPQELFA